MNIRSFGFSEQPSGTLRSHPVGPLAQKAAAHAHKKEDDVGDYEAAADEFFDVNEIDGERGESSRSIENRFMRGWLADPSKEGDKN